MLFSYAIALTGSIATGKSSVANILRSMGFSIIDADSISHAILEEQQTKIIEIFGKHLVSEGKVDRKALGTIVFSDVHKRELLEKLLHPLIYERIASLSGVLEKNKSPYFIDIPLFFENKRYPIRKSLVVFSPKDLQLKRLMQRDTCLKEVAQNRIDTQIDIGKKVKWADYVIDNSGTLTQLKHECERVKDEIEKDFR